MRASGFIVHRQSLPLSLIVAIVACYFVRFWQAPTPSEGLMYSIRNIAVIWVWGQAISEPLLPNS